MIVSAHELYIIVTYIFYEGISGDTDNLYTDKDDAQKMADKLSEPTRLGKLKHIVMSLSDYIRELESEARQQGRQDGYDSAAGADY